MTEFCSGGCLFCYVNFAEVILLPPGKKAIFDVFDFITIFNVRARRFDVFSPPTFLTSEARIVGRIWVV